jgi:hypothetical protein
MLTDHLEALLTLCFAHEEVNDLLHGLNSIAYAMNVGIEHVWIQFEGTL